MKRIKRIIACFIINHFLCGTHFFRLKRHLLNWGNIPCGSGSKMVGPLYIGSVAKLQIGDNVWIGRNFSVYGNGKVVLKNNIDIAPDVAFATGSHQISNDSTHRAGSGISYTIVVEDGVWIGVRSTIMGDTIINSGSVIGACSLVNKSINKDGVYVGIPAKRIKEI